PLFYQVQGISPDKLCALKEDLLASWDDHYASATYPPPEHYKNEKIDTESNRYVQKKHFSHPQLGHVRQLVAMFEDLYPLEIQSVWFIKKSRGGDGFQRWHQDLVGVGTVAATIVLNIDSLGREEEENDLSARHIKSSRQKIIVYTGHKHYDSVISSSAGDVGNGPSASGTGGSVAMNTRYQARKAKLAWENKESTGRVVNDSQLEGDDSPPTGMTWPQQSVKQSASEDSPTEEKEQPEDAGNKRAAVLSTAATTGFPGKFVGFYPPPHESKDDDSEYSYEGSDSDYSDSYSEGQE
ncbi:MAG: hypothetical protein ACKO1Z_02765, partial [Actinomycetota bacterium]